MAAVFTYSASTLIVGRHGYHPELAATAALRGSLVVKKSHAALGDTLSPKAAASVRHGGVSSIRYGSADAGKNNCCFVCCCSSSTQAAHSLCASVTQCFLGLVHISIYKSFYCKRLHMRSDHSVTTRLGRYLNTLTEFSFTSTSASIS